MAALTLRKRLPLYCLAKDTSGKCIHLDAPLTEAEGDVCTAHALQAAETVAKFFTAPIEPVKPVVESLDALTARRKGLPPIWP